MKTISALLACMTMAFAANAQWTNFPDPPLAICAAANEQNAVKAVSDGADGWYVLWLDGRVSNSKDEVYGQHVNADGVALWEADGRQLIADPVKKVGDVAVCLTDAGSLFIAWVHGTDTLKAQLLDAAGASTWPQPGLVPGRFNANAYSSAARRMLAGGNGAFVTWMADHQGSNAVVAYNVVDGAGGVMHGFNGIYIPGSGYAVNGVNPDGSGGMFIHWATANALGAGIRVRRVDANGDLQWVGNVAPTAGSAGISDGEYTAVYDGTDGLVVVWNNSGDVLMSRVDISGTLTWSPAIKPVCVQSNTQRRPTVVAQGGHLYFAWSDARPPASNFDLFGQKMDLNGDPLWTVDGVLAIQENTYIPHARIAPTPDGGAYVVHKASGGFKAMLLNSSGVPVWNPAYKMTEASYAPFYGDVRMLPTSDGNAVIFWATQGNNIHGTRIDPSSGISTGISAPDDAVILTAFPNPAHDRVNIVCGADLFGKRGVIEVFDATGKRVQAEQVASLKVLQELELSSDRKEGLYLVMVRVEGQAPRSARLVVSR
ncbi:MAG: T9SS type A sorting domain-containing protein [Flavobacteriales bacterium]|nr:T9SS type A sorting domain-containing protein [Flavobacteriales bacterium]